tara:strand:- start:561 stop:722 length:162 start_codon:yes stop_codon:yes gene_type:complete
MKNLLSLSLFLVLSFPVWADKLMAQFNAVMTSEVKANYQNFLEALNAEHAPSE